MTADNRSSLQQPGGRNEVAPLRKSVARAMHPRFARCASRRPQSGSAASTPRVLRGRGRGLASTAPAAASGRKAASKTVKIGCASSARISISDRPVARVHQAAAKMCQPSYGSTMHLWQPSAVSPFAENLWRARCANCSACVVGFHPASERWWWTCISQNFKHRRARAAHSIERHWQDSAASAPRPPRACCFAEAAARD